MPPPLDMPPDDELRSPLARATIGLLHPGEMGVAVGASAVLAGSHVLWHSEGRSEATQRRAAYAGFEDVAWLNAMVNRSHVILSVVPPHAAYEVAESVAILGFNRVYVDANAVSPATARTIGDLVESCGASYVDGGIIGPPPWKEGTTRLYLAGEEAPRVARLLHGGPLDIVVLDAPVGAASALKTAYAAWTKGTSALLASVEALALHEGVAEPLLAEWARSQPGLAARADGLGTAAAKAWRWTGEMDEIASAFAAAGLPDGFPRAAREVYARMARWKDDASAPGGLDLATTLLPAPQPDGGASADHR